MSEETESCNPEEFICTVKQYFEEKGKYQTNGFTLDEVMSKIKPIFSDKLGEEIAVAEYRRDSSFKPYDYMDIINLRDEIAALEKAVKEHPGLYNEAFIKQQVENKTRLYQDLLFEERRAFHDAIKKKNEYAVYVGVIRRLPDDVAYDLTDKEAIVKELLQGKSVNQVKKNHPDLPARNVDVVAKIIERGEAA